MVRHKSSMAKKFLCRLDIGFGCESNYLVDVIDLVYAFCPIYSEDPPSHNLYYHHHTNFVGYMESMGITVSVVEGIYAWYQDYIMTKPNNFPYEIQVHLTDIFYLRENLLNYAARKTWGMWQYCLWIDAHQYFLYRYWFEDSIWAMEHHDGV